MRRLFTILGLLLTALPLGSSVSRLSPFRLDDPQGKAYHHIHFETAVEADSCSSAAVGPHALLTATHCELGTDVVDVDGVNYDISQKLRDGADHTILILPGAHFSDTLALDQRSPLVGERIRGWGWPGNIDTVIYKEGRVLKTIEIEGVDPPTWLFAYPVFAGDSGGPVLSDDNKILTVVSLGDNSAHMVGFALAFTPAQLAAIR
jgi:V8-like Glu-specific endopeptidase